MTPSAAADGVGSVVDLESPVGGDTNKKMYRRLRGSE